MSKKSKKNRENLPEGMSRRQAKLAKRAAEREALARDPRPFGGLACEADLVALQMFVPSAVATVAVDGAERPVRIVTVLPGAGAAVVRGEGDAEEALVALQVQSRTDNAGRDLAYALNWARSAASGETLSSTAADGSQPQLTDLIAPDAELDITVHDDFSWWVPEGVTPDMAVNQAIQQANATIMPSERIDADVPGAVWWVNPGSGKAHIRWVRPEKEEDKVLTALARIAARGELKLGEETKFAGVFRTHGLVVPVWDLDPERATDSYGEDLARVQAAIEAEYGNDAQLSADERKQLQNIKSRQVTIG